MAAAAQSSLILIANYSQIYLSIRHRYNTGLIVNNVLQ